MLVMGIDPGLSRCGYGVIRQKGRAIEAIAAGIIRTDKDDSIPRRLFELQNELVDLMGTYSPDAVAIEQVLFQVNVRTAMGVGQASGVAMAAAVGAGAEVFEYSPTQIKKAVTGWGGADKEQMGKMVQTLLGLPHPLKPVDAADAVAAALCHLAHAPTATRIQAAV
ncbi:MAG: crossover junction endodeoxyribonuclease RuvC [Acidimicrobiia bacterium]|nr:crossover junction endodeoxyribonuclease RuvC [bacterium]MXW58768.1 crossover junction endodeoxyribonuclease RuvC [Acidimicrobiia bacterium]MYB11389.1 crossover junction endodeoxyribonuclease RuvC [Acidimicrobiia bacterium]MYB74903.1 crossover junction endodeoxyribonuclease RuvC [Acidimicrobiia bacterium]MYG58540.1 crossover junction endodeoxyribonuclease RuvC [Acidimicrobiia bacterium]